MPPVAAALLPHPPLLVPELAGSAASELDPLRAACRHALEEVLAAAPGTIILIGGGPVWGIPEPAARGSFRPYGADVEVTLPALLDPGPGEPARLGGLPCAPDRDLDPAGPPAPARLAELPLSLAVAAYLLAGLRPAPARLAAVTVPMDLGPGAAAALGRDLVTAARRQGAVGVVVLGDLSACRTEPAPGAFRPEAAELDASIAAAFREGRPDRLMVVDPGRAADLGMAGRAPLQVLAGALEGAPGLRGRVLYEAAPYGVGYLVALLTAP
jgi:hypothetical protein